MERGSPGDAAGQVGECQPGSGPGLCALWDRSAFQEQPGVELQHHSSQQQPELGAAGPADGQVYQYLRIGENIANSTGSVDPYISNVTYNFRVNSSWLALQSTPAQNMTLLKYVISNSTWIIVPTTLLGYNTNFYYYSAVSNSFSLYAIAYLAPSKAKIPSQVIANGGFVRATMVVNTGKANLTIASGSPFYGIRARFRNSAMTNFTITVSNSTQQLVAPHPVGQQVYQYVRINDSQYNSTSSVDQYLSNVSYSFRVSSTWVALHNIPAQNLVLLKYISANATWVALPTTLMSYNYSYFGYYAVSNSFSLYAIAYRIPLNSTIAATGGTARATLAVKSRNANLNISSGSVVYGIRAHFRNSSVAQFNISVTNSSRQLGVALPANRKVYQYIRINQSLYNSTGSVDPYLTNITYSFQVNSSWLALQNTPAQNVTLLKYVNSSASWITLPTTLTAYNSSSYSYDYSAVSNSFSLYAITYPNPSNTAITANHLGLSLAAGFPTYFFAGAVNGIVGARITSFNWTREANETLNPGATPNSNAIVDIGNSVSLSGTFNSFLTTTGNIVITGLAANVIMRNGNIITGNSVKNIGSSNALVVKFTAPTSNSFVIAASRNI